MASMKDFDFLDEIKKINNQKNKYLALEIEHIRKMLDGCFNRISCTDNNIEINEQVNNIIYYLSEYVKKNKIRIERRNNNE